VDFAFGVKDFFHNFLIYHYLFFGVLFFASIFMLILGVILRKRVLFAVFFYIGSFTSLFIAPFVGSYYLEEYIRGSSLQNIKIARLVYTPAIIVSGELKNNGKIATKGTYLLFSMVKKDNNSILEFINIFKPVKTQKVYLKYQLAPNETKEIRVVLDISKITIPTSYAVYYQIKSF